MKFTPFKGVENVVKILIIVFHYSAVQWTGSLNGPDMAALLLYLLYTNYYTFQHYLLMIKKMFYKAFVAAQICEVSQIKEN